MAHDIGPEEYDDEPKCTCGSGAHPRRCAVHPEAFDAHVKELNAENRVEVTGEQRFKRMRECVYELDSAERGHADADALYAELHRFISQAERDAAELERLKACLSDTAETLGKASAERAEHAAELTTLRASLAQLQAERLVVTDRVVVAEMIADLERRAAKLDEPDGFCLTLDMDGSWRAGRKAQLLTIASNLRTALERQ